MRESTLIGLLGAQLTKFGKRDGEHQERLEAKLDRLIQLLEAKESRAAGADQARP